MTAKDLIFQESERAHTPLGRRACPIEKYAVSNPIVLIGRMDDEIVASIEGDKTISWNEPTHDRLVGAKSVK